MSWVWQRRLSACYLKFVIYFSIIFTAIADGLYCATFLSCCSQKILSFRNGPNRNDEKIATAKKQTLHFKCQIVEIMSNNTKANWGTERLNKNRKKNEYSKKVNMWQMFDCKPLPTTKVVPTRTTWRKHSPEKWREKIHVFF